MMLIDVCKAIGDYHALKVSHDEDVKNLKVVLLAVKDLTVKSLELVEDSDLTHNDVGYGLELNLVHPTDVFVGNTPMSKASLDYLTDLYSIIITINALSMDMDYARLNDKNPTIRLKARVMMLTLQDKIQLMSSIYSRDLIRMRYINLGPEIQSLAIKLVIAVIIATIIVMFIG